MFHVTISYADLPESLVNEFYRTAEPVADDCWNQCGLGDNKSEFAATFDYLPVAHSFIAAIHLLAAAHDVFLHTNLEQV